MQKKTKPRPRKIVTNKNCYYDETKKEPNYLDYEDLKKFVTERGRIMNRAYSGICNKHQKRLATAIKRARHLGLLPFRGGM